MIHPNVPAIMVTPICPHSLSFRPIVVPAGVELMVRRSMETVLLSFGKKKQKKHIQHLLVQHDLYKSSLPLCFHTSLNAQTHSLCLTGAKIREQKPLSPPGGLQMWV